MKLIRTSTKQLTDNSFSVFDMAPLNVGDTVFTDIYIKKNEEYYIIIETGTILTEKLYAQLKGQEKLYVLKNGLSEDKALDCSTFLVRIKRNKSSLDEALKLLYNMCYGMFNDFMTSESDEIDLDRAEAIVEAIVFLIRNNENFLKKVMPILKNDYKMPTHSLNVTLYALYIGYMKSLSSKELLKLGQAALLQDVGKKKFCSIVNKNEKLSEDELDQVKEHVKLSVDILKQNNITNASILNAVAQHHERFDGSGYPDGLIRNKISDFGSILAISDVFDALTVDKPNRKANTTFESLKIMMKDPSMKGKFNDGYIRLLLS